MENQDRRKRVRSRPCTEQRDGLPTPEFEKIGVPPQPTETAGARQRERHDCVLSPHSTTTTITNKAWCNAWSACNYLVAGWKGRGESDTSDHG